MKIENIYQVINNHPGPTVILMIIVVALLSTLLLKSWWILLRHLNVRKHGWPPAHCDSDGDPVEFEPEEDPS